MRFVYTIVCFFSLFACTKTSKTEGAESNKKAEFYVRGNCEMCKERIESTAKSIKGVGDAEWNENSGNLKVSFDSTLITEIEIHKAIAASGHGTKQVEMDPKAHGELPECCQVGNKH